MNADAEPAWEELQIRVLGSVEVLVGAHRVDLGPRRQRTVLARLVVDAGRPVAVDRLVDDVWDGCPPPGSLRTLRSYVSRLRRALGPFAGAIATRSPGYAVEAPADVVDARRFERLAAEGRALLERRHHAAAAARLRDGLGLWRGDPFADLAGHGFLAAEAMRLQALRLAALEDRLETEVALGRHRDALAELERLVEEQPLRERGWGLLMTALYRAGRQGDALAAFQRARRVLVEELGVEPGPDLRAVEAAVLRQDVAIADPRPRHNLPAPLTAFVGREREVALVLEQIGRRRLVTLTGVGGAGKTRIAMEAASRLSEGYPGGVWLVDLSTVTDGALVAQTVLATLEIDERSGRPAVMVLRDHLAEQPSLLVLDNCEHLVEACAGVTGQLLDAAPDLRVLATSREPLGLPGEVVLDVPPLGTPPPGETVELDRYDAVRLFVERASEPPPAAELATVAHICRELDGIPLAIEIAAAQTRVMSTEEISARLGDRFRLLTYWSRTALPRHRTLRASIDWSYALLSPDERSFLHRLAPFAGGFTLDAAEAVAPAGGPAVELLRRLVDASLVQRRDPDTGRFRMLETVRQHAAERAAEAGEHVSAARRHAELHAALAEQARLALEGADEARIRARLEEEQANIRAALEHAHSTGERGLLVTLARGMGNHWRLRYPDEGEIWLPRAIDASSGMPHEVRADLHGHLGSVALRRNRFADAGRHLSTAVELAREGGDDRQLGRWMHQLAYGLRAQGHFDRSRAVLAEALQVARWAGDRVGAAHRLGSLADIAVHEGRLDDADRLFAEVWELVQPAQPAHIVAFMESTARLHLERGDVDEGARRAEMALGHARDLGDDWHVGLCLVSLAYVEGQRGDRAAAARHLLSALDALWRIREAGGVAEALDILGGLLLDAGDPQEAAAAYGAADALRREFGIPVAALVRSYVARDRRALLGLLDGRPAPGWAGSPADLLAAARRAAGRLLAG